MAITNGRAFDAAPFAAAHAAAPREGIAHQFALPLPGGEAYTGGHHQRPALGMTGTRVGCPSKGYR